MNRRSVCIVTTTRAEYGVLRSLIRETAADPELELRLLVTGTHLSEDHGYTVRDIEADGFPIWQRVPIQVAGGDEEAAVRTIGAALLALAPIFARERPDILVVVGDRTEAIACGLTTLLMRIPLAHLHGGEITAGAVDEAIRHALTKMATYHFVATAEYAANVIQLGEDPARVFTVGAPGLDGLRDLRPLAREPLFARLDLDPAHPTALVTFHPETVRGAEAIMAQVGELLAALERLDLQVVFTGANADAHGAQINTRLQAAARERPARYRYFASLGGELYFSCLRHVDLMIGNSSSGIIEAPSFGLPVVNLGSRQEGRVMAGNILPAACAREEIARAVGRARSEDFRSLCRTVVNPYAPHGVGAIGRRIRDTLKAVSLAPEVIKKRFVRLGRNDAQIPPR
ncbi:MAG: UDP-N-acetylglucosamine 2-epimerase [Candidatus Eisenbacteria bacterium]